jgi:hypothetical protein
MARIGVRLRLPPPCNQRFANDECANALGVPRDSTSRFYFLGHEEDSNPRRSDRRDTRSDTGVPDHFISFIQLMSPYTCMNSPVAQFVERPALAREVDGANPSGVSHA